MKTLFQNTILPYGKNMKRLLALFALIPALTFGQGPAPIPFEVNSRVRIAPPQETFRGNVTTFRVTYKDGGSTVNLSNNIPFMSWSVTNTSAAIVTSTWAFVSAVSGVVDFTFSAANVNTNGNFIYEVGVRDLPQVYKQGVLTIKRSPFNTSTGSVTFSTNVNWGLYTYSNTSNAGPYRAGANITFTNNGDGSVTIIGGAGGGGTAWTNSVGTQTWANSGVVINPGSNVAFIKVGSTAVTVNVHQPETHSAQNYIRADGTIQMSADLSIDGNQVVDVADPIAAQDAATKAFVMTVSNNLGVAGTLQRAYNAGNTITNDGTLTATNLDLKVNSVTLQGMPNPGSGTARAKIAFETLAGGDYVTLQLPDSVSIANLVELPAVQGRLATLQDIYDATNAIVHGTNALAFGAGGGMIVEPVGNTNLLFKSANFSKLASEIGASGGGGASPQLRTTTNTYVWSGINITNINFACLTNSEQIGFGFFAGASNILDVPLDIRILPSLNYGRSNAFGLRNPEARMYVSTVTATSGFNGRTLTVGDAGPITQWSMIMINRSGAGDWTGPVFVTNRAGSALYIDADMLGCTATVSAVSLFTQYFPSGPFQVSGTNLPIEINSGTNLVTGTVKMIVQEATD